MAYRQEYRTNIQITFNHFKCFTFWPIPHWENNTLGLKSLKWSSPLLYAGPRRHIYKTAQDTQSVTLSAHLKLTSIEPERANRHACNPIRFPAGGVRSGLGQLCCEPARQGMYCGHPTGVSSWSESIGHHPPKSNFCSLDAALATRQNHFGTAWLPRPSEVSTYLTNFALHWLMYDPHVGLYCADQGLVGIFHKGGRKKRLN